MQTLRDLFLPLLSLLAVIGGVYLMSQQWPSQGDVQPRHKLNLSHRSSKPPPALPEGDTHSAPASTVAAKPVEAIAPVATADESIEHWTTRYDEHFRKYTKRYFGVDFDWRWFKAQAIVESTLNPHAHNDSGAVGLMQIKPMTFREIRKHDPEIHSLNSPRWNIAAGISYVRHLYDKTAIKVFPDSTRLYLAFASYNVGYTRMLRVMHQTPPEKMGWRTTLMCGPIEARHYVERIIAVKAAV